MEVKRVTLEDADSAYCCMTEMPQNASWSEPLSEAIAWFRSNLGESVEGYHVLDDRRVVGHVYWEWSEKALIPHRVEPGVAFIYCTEVMPSYAGKKYGKAMLDYVKEDLRKQGCKGIMVDASNFKAFMYYESFLKQGFRVLQEHGIFRLMYFPLTKQSVGFRLGELSYEPSRDKVEVTLFNLSFCPFGVSMHHLFKRVAEGFGGKVRIVEIEAAREIIQKFGTSDPLINGKIKIFGPASEKDVQKAIEEELALFESHSAK